MGWTEALAVGVPKIDEQHKTWFQKAEQLFDAGQHQKAAEFIWELLVFLDSYTKQHFQDEEVYMRQIHYPEYELQKRLHTEFIAKLDQLKKDYQASGSNLMVIMNANQMVLNWLTQHITVQDKKIGQFVKQQKRKA